MSHITIIISRSKPASEDASAERQVSYSYELPVPHDATPQQVGEMVRRAYRRLEGADGADD